MATIPGDCGCDGQGCDVCEEAHPVLPPIGPRPRPTKLATLRQRLAKAKAAKTKAHERACNATARLSDAEEKVWKIEGQIKRLVIQFGDGE